MGNKTKNKTTKTQKKKQEKQNDKTQLSATTTPPCGVQSCFFGFLFFGFLVSCFLVQVAPWRAKDLDLALCQFSHFRGCRLAFGWFYYLLWACGSISNHCKKLWQNASITGGSLGGLGHKLGNFVCLCNFSKTVLNKCKNIGSQWMCRTDFDNDMLGSNRWISTCSYTLKDSLEKEWCISLKWVLPSTSAILF